MSEPGNPPPPLPNYTGGQIALILFGVLFLFPGGCALLFALGGFADFLQRGRVDPFIGSLVGLWLFCFAISAVGIVMIRVARKRARGPS
jgi:hypothetical protein